MNKYNKIILKLNNFSDGKLKRKALDNALIERIMITINLTKDTFMKRAILTSIFALAMTSAHAHDAAKEIAMQCKKEAAISSDAFLSARNHISLQVKVDETLLKNRKSTSKAKLGFEGAVLYGYDQVRYNTNKINEQDVSRQAYENCLRKFSDTFYGKAF